MPLDCVLSGLCVRAPAGIVYVFRIEVDVIMRAQGGASAAHSTSRQRLGIGRTQSHGSAMANNAILSRFSILTLAAIF